MLEGIETLTSDRKAHARHELWCRHLVPELRSASSQAFEETSDSANVIEPATTVYGKDSIARSINSDVFILREDLDKDLINAWHTTVLPALDDMISSASDPSIVVSLQREGLNEVESHAVIRVRSSIKRSAFEKDRLKHDLLSVLPEKLRSDCTVEFSKGSIQRSGGDTKTMETGEHHPPICEPRNRRWVHKPTMGASIGRWGSEDHTATLGGYVVIDGITYILTVHHLFEDEKKVQASENGGLRRGQYRITQPSQQELRDIDVEVLSLRNKIGRFEAGQETLLQWMSQIRALERLQDMIPREKDLLSFGEVVASSGYRSRVSRARTANQSSLGTGWPMEMDWAICSVIEDRIGDNELDVQLRCNESGASAFQLARGGTSQNPSDKKNIYTKTCEVFGGIAVHSLGRTSHYQTGLVSPCQAWIRQGNAVGGFRSSFEWTIVRPAAKSIKEWNEGGMGVDGDSGSWIVREHSNELMGMLWGRYQDDDIEDPITFFTPIHDVFDDIIDTLGPKRIGLPQEQNPSTSALRAGSLNSAASRVPLITDSLAPSTKRRYPPSPEKIPPAKRKDLGAPHRRCRCSQPTFPLQLTPPATPARYA